jgi:hypothetical protein
MVDRLISWAGRARTRYQVLRAMGVGRFASIWDALGR